MKNKMDPQNQAVLQQLSSAAVVDSLPKLEELPEANRLELIQALAALLMHQPALQVLLKVRHEPEQ